MTPSQSSTAAPEIAEHEPAIAPNKARRMYLIVGGAVVLLVLVYGIYAFFSSGKETTDDAQVAADVVPVSARVAGQVLAIGIVENQPVHRGDLIVQLDPQEAQLREGMRPGDPGFGETEGLERGRYIDFYVGVRDWARGDAPAPVDPLDSLHVLEILDAARESSERREAVLTNFTRSS